MAGKAVVMKRGGLECRSHTDGRYECVQNGKVVMARLCRTNLTDQLCVVSMDGRLDSCIGVVEPDGKLFMESTVLRGSISSEVAALRRLK